MIGGGGEGGRGEEGVRVSYIIANWLFGTRLRLSLMKLPESNS